MLIDRIPLLAHSLKTNATKPILAVLQQGKLAIVPTLVLSAVSYLYSRCELSNIIPSSIWAQNGGKIDHRFAKKIRLHANPFDLCFGRR